MEIGTRPASGGISGLRRNYGASLTILPGVTGVVLLIAGGTLLASWLPARRASRLSPTAALGEE